jgi:hypothetical protein
MGVDFFLGFGFGFSLDFFFCALLQEVQSFFDFTAMYLNLSHTLQLSLVAFPIINKVGSETPHLKVY